jgi:hypothetical protein
VKNAALWGWSRIADLKLFEISDLKGLMKTPAGTQRPRHDFFTVLRD